jgi:hypothetical protein
MKEIYVPDDPQPFKTTALSEDLNLNSELVADRT